MARMKARDQRDGFEDRLARIKKGGANTMGEVHLGPREEVRAGDKSAKPTNTVRIKKKKTKSREIGRGSAISLIFIAFVFGALSMFVGQVADFHLFNEGGLAPIDLSETPVGPYLQFAALAIGGVLALMFCWTFRLTSILRLAAAAAGVFCMVEFHTNMVQGAPGLFVKFFSKGYVETVKEMPKSTLFAA
ncbi:MAG: hypothetical protein OIF48_09220 [Silicimonas sp.]|nr:hypothetical protein [Silicimonas sp.]